MLMLMAHTHVHTSRAHLCVIWVPRMGLTCDVEGTITLVESAAEL